jgi:hypothetical protein
MEESISQMVLISISTPIIHQLELIYNHTTDACSTVMTYATSTPTNAPRKRNTIKTDAPDHLLGILSPYSTKSDGQCLVCLLSRGRAPSLRPQSPASTASRPRLDSSKWIFYGKKLNINALPSPTLPFPFARDLSWVATRPATPPSPPTASLPCRRFHLPLQPAPRVPSPVLIERLRLLLQVWWTTRVSSDGRRAWRRLPRWPRLSQPHLHWAVSLDPMPNVMATALAGCSPRGVIRARSSRSSLLGVARGMSMSSSRFHPLASYSGDVVP